MGYTKFGEQFRILRIRHREVLADATKFLGATSSFISAVETGKKNVPEKWLDLITEHYSLNEEERHDLAEAIRESRTTVKIDMVAASDVKRSVAMQFQRSFDEIDEETAKEIMEILKRNK